MYYELIFKPKAPGPIAEFLNPENWLKWKKDKKTIRVGPLLLDLVSIKNLIKMKRRAGREQDLGDIKSLKKLMRFSRKK